MTISPVYPGIDITGCLGRVTATVGQVIFSNVVSNWAGPFVRHKIIPVDHNLQSTTLVNIMVHNWLKEFAVKFEEN